MKFLSLAVLVALAALCFHRPAEAAGKLTLALAGNGTWLNGPDSAFPRDVEAGGTVATSLSPHISLVGSSFYGFKENYVRYQGGARITATDVNDPNFNVFLGLQYRGGSQSAVGPSEGAPDAGFGWKPNKSWPKVVLGADAGYGLQSNRVIASVALRYLIVNK